MIFFEFESKSRGLLDKMSSQKDDIQNTENTKLKSFVICRMYAGKYISTKIGGEIINLLHDDNDNNYIYVNPSGYIAKEYDDTVNAVILVRLLQKGCFEILGVAKIGPKGQLVYPTGYTQKEKHISTGKQLQEYVDKYDIRYDGVRLSEILPSGLNGAITFKSDVLLQPIKSIYLTDCDHENIVLDNKTIYLKDKRFPAQSLISYIDNIKNPVAFETIEKAINDSQLWWTHKKNKVKDNQLVDKNFNFLNIIKKDEDELVYSNLLYYFLSRYPDLMIRFAYWVLDIDLTLPYNIEREKENIDLWIEDDNNIIVIENKIKAGISGVSPRHDFSEDGLVQSQLSKYYNYGEKIKGNRKSNYFIFLPVYNRIDIKKYSGSKHYKKISYQQLYEFFLTEEYHIEELANDNFYQEFIKTLYKHTNVIQDDYYQEMAYRFLQRINQVKKKKSEDERFFEELYKKIDNAFISIAEFGLEKASFENPSKYLNETYKKDPVLAKEIITKYFNNADEVLIEYMIIAIQGSQIDYKEKWFIDLLKSKTDFENKSLKEKIKDLIS